MKMKIIRLNLKRHQTRKDFGNGALVAMGFHFDDIIVWEAKDNLPYHKTFMLMEDAIRDGFPHFQILLDTDRDSNISIMDMSYHWNWCRMLRHIASGTEPVIAMLDDYYFCVRPNVVQQCFVDANDIALSEGVPLKYVALEYSKTSTKPIEYVASNDNFIIGISSSGGDKAAIITPPGADYLLREWTTPPFKDFFPSMEVLLVNHNFEEPSGVYTNALKFICNLPGTLNPSSLQQESELGDDGSPRSIIETRRED